VVDDGQRRGPAAGPNLMMLLERPYRQLAAAVVDRVTSGCPGRLWDELVRLALAWPSEYWPGLALAWLEDGYRLSGVRQAVVAVKDGQRRSQPLRHRALRLCKQADR
jgi:hypothetical protein